MKRYIDDLNPGDAAIVGYRNHRIPTRFVGWKLEDGKPRASFRDHDGMEWDAYMYEGRFCVGSSADELKVYG